MKLSVVIPVYNERNTLPQILAQVAKALPEVSKEIIIVDDGSTDGTREWLGETFGKTNPHPVPVTAEGKVLHAAAVSPQECLSVVRVVLHKQNQGKGAALRTGFQCATGEVVVIQDADLEYDPQDWIKMWRLIVGGWADVVYGSRFYGEPHRALYFHHYLGNKLISTLINWLCDITLSDIEVCYKMFRKEVLDSLKLVSNDFGIEVELTAKVAKTKRWRIYETGISYYGRTYSEGKKINWRDGIKALGYIAKFRFSD